MNSITSSNREIAKIFLRENKNFFSDNFLNCTFSDIQGLTLNHNSSTVQGTDSIKLISFDVGEEVDLDPYVDSGDKLYFPGLPGDTVSVGIGTTNYDLSFNTDDVSITYDSVSYGLNDILTLGDTSFTIFAVGGVGVGVTPTYIVTPSETSVDEGAYITFTVTGTNIPNGPHLFIKEAVSGDFTTSDYAGGFAIETFSVNSGIGSFAILINNDSQIESDEQFRVTIKQGTNPNGPVVATSPVITINAPPASYSVTPSATSVSEGNSVNFTVNTTNVSAGTTLYYSTGGSSVDTTDFSDGSLTGSFNIVSTGATTGVGTITRSIATDFLTETSESFVIQIRTDSISGSIVATSSTVDITDTVATFSTAVSSTTVDEGGSISFTVSGSNIPNGTYYYSIEGVSGTVSSSDFSGNLSGSFTVSNNSGSFTITLADDLQTEGEEKFKVRIRRDSATGTIVATSSDITINDTSRAVSANANGLTFGPVQVNRDSGVAANASDWYTICGLDNVPDNSSIALFIDGSGSMTQATVQASYDLLVSKLNARGITITSVTNPNEDWITPFLVDLP